MSEAAAAAVATPYAASAPHAGAPRALWFAARRGADAARHRGSAASVVIITAVRRRHRQDGVITANGQAAADRARPRTGTRGCSSSVGRTRRRTATSSTAPDRRCSSARSSDTITGHHGRASEWRAFTQIDSSGDGDDRDHLHGPVADDVAQVRLGQPVDTASARRRRAARGRGDPGARRRRVRGPAGDHDPVVQHASPRTPHPAASRTALEPPTGRLRPRPRRAARPAWARAAR